MNRNTLAKHILSRVEAIADEIVTVIWERMEAHIEQAFEAARTVIASELLAEVAPAYEPGTTPVDPPASRPRPPRSAKVAPAAPPVEPAPKRIPHNKGGQVVCTVCRQPGHNARRHKRDGVSKPEQPPASDEEDGGADGVPGHRAAPSAPAPDDAAAPAARVGRRPRRRGELAEDPPVIQHGTLVAMLAADRAHNAVGDVGGFVARADRSASLVGPTAETREVCPVHGWVGRFQFDRGRHDLCRPVGEPCDACSGAKVVSDHFCERCDGTGVEPLLPPPSPLLDEPAAIACDAPGDDVVRANDPSAMIDGVRIRKRRTEPRSETVARKHLTRLVLAEGRAELEAINALDLLDAPRPRTRAECGTQRPCPFVGCAHHLFLDVDPETGSIKFNFPEIQPEDLEHSCVLDAADMGGHTLEAVGEKMNLTRERVRQVEVAALLKLREPATVITGEVPAAALANAPSAARALAGSTRGDPSSDRAARIRAHRDDLVRRGICTNGENHGPATHGRLCERCHSGFRWREAGAEEAKA